MSELFDKEVNAQKESLKKTSGVHASSCMPTKKVAMKMKNKQIRKKRWAPKIFLMEGGVYKVIAEHSCNGYQTTPAQRFLIH